MIETEQKTAPAAEPATAAPHVHTHEPRRGGLPKPLRALLVLGALAAVATLVWFFFLRKPPEPAGVLSVTGRLEGDDSAVAAKVSGRIREITVREGDTVAAGQVIATLDDEQVRAREEQARSAVTQAEARVARARQQISVLEEQLEQSQLGIEQARTDARGRVDQAEAQVATAEADLARSQATYERARWDAERFGRLAKEGVESERTAKQAEMEAQAQAAAVRAARRQVDVARAAVETAKANLANPAIRTAATAAVQKQIVQAQSDVDAAEADAERSRAQLTEAVANRTDLSIIAPFAGTVATRTAEPGEVVAPGTPIITLVDLGQVYLRAFIPEGDIHRVVVGQKARVFLDGAPDRPLDAVVERIDPEASFTPENTYFRDDRVKQVFGVRVRLTGGAGAAKPGMPADGKILVDGDTWPAGTEKA
jgi:HlyD family secretion protein